MNPSLYKHGSFEVSEHQMLSMAEVELINKIVALGAQYKLIKEFLDRYSGLSSSLSLHLAYGANADRGKKKKEGQEADEEEEDAQED